MRAAVLRPRCFVMTLVEGALFTVADGAHAVGLDAERSQEVARRVGAAGAERAAVLLAAAPGAVCFAEEIQGPILPEPCLLGGQCGLGVRPNGRGIEDITRIPR